MNHAERYYPFYSPSNESEGDFSANADSRTDRCTSRGVVELAILAELGREGSISPWKPKVAKWPSWAALGHLGFFKGFLHARQVRGARLRHPNTANDNAKRMLRLGKRRTDGLR